ncbi:MAG: hypothetical protein ACO3VH_07735, partial [Ilumatobacteraceae bacterium]
MTLDPIAPSRRRRRLLTAASTITIAIPLAVIAVVVGVPALPSLLVGAALGLLATAALASRAQAAVLDVTGARVLGEDESPRLTGLVEGLCLTSGVEAPALFAIDSDT